MPAYWYEAADFSGLGDDLSRWQRRRSGDQPERRPGGDGRAEAAIAIAAAAGPALAMITGG
jgi:hypothetical protein